jgi:hypothetical protein
MHAHQLYVGGVDFTYLTHADITVGIAFTHDDNHSSCNGLPPLNVISDFAWVNGVPEGAVPIELSSVPEYARRLLLSLWTIAHGVADPRRGHPDHRFHPPMIAELLDSARPTRAGRC